ncbi:hypothetical protein ACMD2_15640 [Ananas comosus]|uniref:Uncharacterized protein n=1 Tax=Ananas comosus TaxID=4615 RepID=A0A199UW16_ANACO|nr:hypothetical protein ACMD2_15640 [Ananas comosus]
MKETIRCCIACILPCGALDVVRIVHANGRVEEISGTVSAAEIMRAHPKHVLRRPPPACHVDGADCPAPHPPSSSSSSSDQAMMILPPSAELQRGKIYFLMPVASSSSSSSSSYLSEILSEKASATQRERRRGRVGVISEADF